MISPPKNFSNLQWYLAHAQNCVHFSTYLDREINEQEFNGLVDLVLARAPQMLWCENLVRERHEIATAWRRQDHIQYSRNEHLPASYSEILLDSAAIIQQTSGPAFHAVCHSAKNSDIEGRKSLICISASHTVMEGLDLSALTRSPKPRTIVVENDYKNASLLQRISASTIAPIFGLFHLISANLQRQQDSKCGFASLSVNKADLRKLARSINISQRSLYFSLVLFFLHADRQKVKKNRMVAYSSLKDNRIRQEKDAFLRLKMHVLFVNRDMDFERFAKSIDGALKKQDAGGNFNQHMYDRVLAFHRLIYPLLRPLFSRKFFNYIPYDMVLSLLPPAMPRDELSYLNDTPIFGSSFTRGGENCIIVPGREFLAFNFWAKRETIDALEKLQAALANLGAAGKITR